MDDRKMEDRVDFRMYEDRLGSFMNWPPDSPIFIKELVEAGFYYSGKNDVVVCFSCGIEIGNWKDNEQPLDLHARRNEKCKFLANRKENIANSSRTAVCSLQQNAAQQSPSVDETPTSDFAVCSSSNERLDESNELSEMMTQVGYAALENRLSSIAKYQTSIPTAQARRIGDAGFFFNETGQCFECYHCHTQFDVQDMVEGSDPVILHAELSPSCKFISLVIEMQASINENRENSGGKSEASPPQTKSSMQHSSETVSNVNTTVAENNRASILKQAVGKQGGTHHIATSPERLKLEMPARNFEQALPTVSRLELSPGVHHLNQSNPGSPLSLSGSPLCGPRLHYLHHQESVRSNVSEDESVFREYGSGVLVQRQPSYGSEGPNKSSDVKSKYGRLLTFFTWPQNSPIQPLELCEAGFYYTGVDDGVKCFKCGIALKSWVQGDTAWGEHRKWSAQCQLVREHFNERDVPNYQRSTSNSEPEMQGFREADRTNLHIQGIAGPQSYYNPRQPPLHMPPFCLPPVSNFPPMQMPNLMNVDPFGRPGTSDISLPLSENSGAGLSEPIFYPGNISQIDVGESAVVEQIGSLSEEQFDKLLEAGFAVEMINRVQRLAFEKYGKYFDNLEATADAILFVAEHGSLDEHCLSEEPHDSDESHANLNENSQGKMVGPQPDLKRELEKMREMQLCKICMDAQVGIAFHPCGHLCTCHNCAVGMSQCPLCRANIQSSSRVYLG